MQNGLPFKTPQKSNKSLQELELLHTFSKSFLGHISGDRLLDPTCKMSSLSRPRINQISPPGVGPAPRFSKMFLGQISCDRFRGLPCKMTSLSRSDKKSDKSPQVLDLLHTFSKMLLRHISCNRFRGLLCKMTSLSRPDKNQISPPGFWTCSSLFPKCCLGTFLVTGFWTRPAK